MMMEKCTRWETSGRRSIWVPSVPVLAMADSRWVTVCSYFVCSFIWCLCFYSQMRILMCDCNTFVLKIRDGAVRTVEGQEDKPMLMLMSFIRYHQMPLIDTEKMLYVN